MDGTEPWHLYSTEGAATHLKRPDSDETYCGDALKTYRPQGTVTDPSAFYLQDQFCTDCLYQVLGKHATAVLDKIADSDE